MEGLDGIKTGYTQASGYNLVTSVHRDGRYVVAVVLGGRSSFQRDVHMRELIGAHIKEASLQRTAPAIAEQTVPRDEPQQAAVAGASTVPRTDPTPTATVSTHVAAGSNDPIQPLLVKTVSYRIAPVQAAGACADAGAGGGSRVAAGGAAHCRCLGRHRAAGHDPCGQVRPDQA